jgi:hypothetical protein
MERKNINRGFKKLRVWQDATTLYVMACKVFTDFPFELKKVASNSIDSINEVRRFYNYSKIPAFHYSMQVT